MRIAATYFKMYAKYNKEFKKLNSNYVAWTEFKKAKCAKIYKDY